MDEPKDQATGTPAAMDARSELIKIAAACARFQHNYVDELEQDDLKQFGRYAHVLEKIADRMNP